ncbi:hypothetical protein VE02_03624 [Pseudogymnoascus sp. 03VT05]|nr:hypothetical protein VE02_03624 [Pseudogymnoascus sp. 03VT05]
MEEEGQTNPHSSIVAAEAKFGSAREPSHQLGPEEAAKMSSRRLSTASSENPSAVNLKSSISEPVEREAYVEPASFSLPRSGTAYGTESSRASSTISHRGSISDMSEAWTEGTNTSINDGAVEESETPRMLSESTSDLTKHAPLPEPAMSKTGSTTSESKRMSSSSLYSLQSARAGGVAPSSNSSSGDAIPRLNPGKISGTRSLCVSPDAATPIVSVTSPSVSPPTAQGATNPQQAAPKDGAPPGDAPKRSRQEGTSRASIPRSRSRVKRRFSVSTGASSHSPSSERGIHQAKEKEPKPAPYGIIGVCALDIKARSKPSRNILNKLIAKGEFSVVVFGDKVILDEDIENWPVCDYLISFYSEGFPLAKAIAYVKARKPFCVNDVPMQQILWDRRICLRILDKINVPSPSRVEVNRDGGPRVMSQDLARHLKETSGVIVQGPEDGDNLLAPPPRKVELLDDGDTLSVDGVLLRKPFVEKPVSGEDHNICIYYPKSQGGGARKLFRKIGNKSSEHIDGLTIPRAILEEGSSYVYEKFMRVDNAEDVKAYTVGTGFCHAETRKSPVVDGLVRRNTHGKEIRYVTSLTKDESAMAARISTSFGQRVCGFDLLRADGKSYVIDVNGWSFVKDNDAYYDQCSSILRNMFIQERERRQAKAAAAEQAKISESVAPSAEASESEMPPPTRKESSLKENHRSTLQSILGRSPSISKLAHLHHNHSPHAKSPEQRSTSPDRSVPTMPLSTASSMEKPVSSMVSSLPHVSSCASISGPVSAAASVRTSQILEPNPEEEEDKELPPPAPKHAWKLKGMVSVIRHADRTPKQKYKYTFHTKPFIELLKGHQEEVLLTGEAALDSVLDAVDVALREGIEDKTKLKALRNVLVRKGGWVGTKVQIKPMFRKRKVEDSPKPTFATIADIPVDVSKVIPSMSTTPGATDESQDPEERPLKRADSLTGVTLSRITAAEESLVLDKLQLIVKWGGEPTHSARYQAQELGENMRNDLYLMNKEVLDEVHVFSSSERRVTTSAQIFSASFLDKKDLASDFITIRKDLLDDSNAAKDEMDKVKKKLKVLLREGQGPPPQFAWPANLPEPSIVQRQVIQLMNFHRKVMRHNYQKLYGGAVTSLNNIVNPGDKAAGESPPVGAMGQATAINNIQARWCCGEDAELFRERWEKLFIEFCDAEKVDPSKISELYDTMKFDALHNRQFLEWVFTPSKSMLEEEDSAVVVEDAASAKVSEDKSDKSERSDSTNTTEKSESSKSVSRRLFRRRSGNMKNVVEETPESYFHLFTGSTKTKAKTDARFEKLRELYNLAKVLFDFICPQEYGITDSEKLEIGLLTSLPLLKEIVADLEEMQASDDAKSFIYFTKESHIYTLLNCILEGGIQTKIARSAIPELDYLSQICFELYESETTPSPAPKAQSAPELAPPADMAALAELAANLPSAPEPIPSPAPPPEQTFAYSIRITISPGCHTYDPLDVQLDSKHCIGCAPRRSLTQHMDWKEVIETLRAKFHQVRLPKSFLAINLSESHTFHRREEEKSEGEGEKGKGSSLCVGEGEGVRGRSGSNGEVKAENGEVREKMEGGGEEEGPKGEEVPGGAEKVNVVF